MVDLVTIKSTIILKFSSNDNGTYLRIPITDVSIPFAKVIVRLVFSIIRLRLFRFIKSSDMTEIFAPVSNIPFISMPYTLQGK